MEPKHPPENAAAPQRQISSFAKAVKSTFGEIMANIELKNKDPSTRLVEDQDQSSRLVEDRPSQKNDVVKYGTKEDVEDLAIDIEARQEIMSMSRGTSPTGHQGVILDNKELTIEDVSYSRNKQWKDIKTLGEGSTSQVYEGEDHQIKNKTFAVKTVKLTEFKSFEVVSWLQFNHPNIPELYGIVRERGLVYIFCEEIEEGQPLSAYLKTRYLELNSPKRRSFIEEFDQQLSSAIEHIHQSGFSHNDVHERNILIDKNLTVNLIDFGEVSRSPLEKGCNDSQEMDRISIEEMVKKVKLAYMKQENKDKEENENSLHGMKNPSDGDQPEAVEVRHPSASGDSLSVEAVGQAVDSLDIGEVCHPSASGDSLSVEAVGQAVDSLDIGGTPQESVTVPGAGAPRESVTVPDAEAPRDEGLIKPNMDPTVELEEATLKDVPSEGKKDSQI